MKKYTYVLRTCKSDMTAHGGFRWPEKGPVEAPDWSPEPVCGKGLHGALRGQGDGSLLSWESDAKWLVVRVVAADVVDLDGKVKFPCGEVVHCGDRATATAYLAKRGCTDGVIGGTATAGNHGTATAGHGGTLAIFRRDGTRRRIHIAYVGEDGIKAGVAYKLDADGKFVEAGK